MLADSRGTRVQKACQAHLLPGTVCERLLVLPPLRRGERLDPAARVRRLVAFLLLLLLIGQGRLPQRAADAILLAAAATGLI